MKIKPHNTTIMLLLVVGLLLLFSGCVTPLVGSRWRLVYDDSKLGHKEYDLVFRQAGKLIRNVTTPEDDSWSSSDRKVVLRINNGYAVYTGELSDDNHMAGTATNKVGTKWKWTAYRIVDKEKHGSANAQDQTLQSIGKEGYAQFNHFPLSKNINGIDGNLILFRDRRAMNLSSNTEESESYKNALLCITDNNSKIIKTYHVEGPIVTLRTVQLIFQKPVTYTLTVDYSCGWGSYAGPATEFFDVIQGEIVWVTATDMETKKTERINLAATLKTAWKLVHSGNNFDILQVFCRPNLTNYKGKGDLDFIITYERYHNNGKEWLLYKKSKVGFAEWEDESDFPEESNFPSSK